MERSRLDLRIINKRRPGVSCQHRVATYMLVVVFLHYGEGEADNSGKCCMLRIKCEQRDDCVTIHPEFSHHPAHISIVAWESRGSKGSERALKEPQSIDLLFYSVVQFRQSQ